MSKENTENVVNTLFSKLAGGASPEEIAALFSDNIDWNVPGDVNSVPWVGKRNTPAQVADFYRTLAANTTPVKFEVLSTITSDDTSVVLGYFESLVIGTRKTIKSEFAMQLQVSNDKIIHYRFYEDSFAVSLALR